MSILKASLRPLYALPQHLRPRSEIKALDCHLPRAAGRRYFYTRVRPVTPPFDLTHLFCPPAMGMLAVNPGHIILAADVGKVLAS